MRNKFIAGEAIRIDGIFRDFPKPDGSQGDLVDPVIIKFITYDSYWKKMEEVIVGPSGRVSLGHYRVFYVFDKKGVYYYEWLGECADSLPAVERKKIVISQYRNE